MRHDFLDRFSRLQSPIHRLSAGSKVLVALLIIGGCVTTPLDRWTVFAALAALLLLVALLSRIPIRFLLRRMLLLEPFVLGIALLSLFQPGGGLVFLGIVVRSSLCLFTMVLLSNTTPFATLLGLLRRLRCPPLLITTLALMYRYLFVLMDEAGRLHRARSGRTFDNRRWPGWKMLATVVSELFVRSTERAERIYAAMLARGWK